MASESGAIEPGVKDDQPSFKPYRSILKFSPSSSRSREHDDQPIVEEVLVRPPPWRRAVGAAYFRHGPGSQDDGMDGKEYSKYAEMMERTFAGFSDEVIGADVPVIDFRNNETEASWDVDEVPDIPLVAGERPVLYHASEDVPAHVAAPTRHT